MRFLTKTIKTKPLLYRILFSNDALVLWRDDRRRIRSTKESNQFSCLETLWFQGVRGQTITSVMITELLSDRVKTAWSQYWVNNPDYDFCRNLAAVLVWCCPTMPALPSFTQMLIRACDYLRCRPDGRPIIPKDSVCVRWGGVTVQHSHIEQAVWKGLLVCRRLEDRGTRHGREEPEHVGKETKIMHDFMIPYSTLWATRSRLWSSHAGTGWLMWLPWVGDSACNQARACNHLPFFFICNFTEGQRFCRRCEFQYWRRGSWEWRRAEDKGAVPQASLRFHHPCQERYVSGRCLRTNCQLQQIVGHSDPTQAPPSTPPS